MPLWGDWNPAIWAHCTLIVSLLTGTSAVTEMVYFTQTFEIQLMIELVDTLSITIGINL
jgi:hypothetical protein